jgi:hypothetical protein
MESLTERFEKVFGHSSHSNGGLVYFRLTVKAPLENFYPKITSPSSYIYPAKTPTTKLSPSPKSSYESSRQQ